MWQRTCKECAYFDDMRCKISGQPAISHNIACASFSSKRYECEICHRQIHHTEVIYDSKSNKIVCSDCCNRLSTCNNCHNGNICLFETDPSPLPKQIQKQIRQGNMIGQTIVKNPDRILITCKKGCPCWDAETESCNKQLRYCANIQEVI
jgi:hypothetical protein